MVKLGFILFLISIFCKKAMPIFLSMIKGIFLCTVAILKVFFNVVESKEDYKNVYEQNRREQND